VTTQSKLLEKKGFVRRKTAVEDARIVKMSLTDRLVLLSLEWNVRLSLIMTRTLNATTANIRPTARYDIGLVRENELRSPVCDSEPAAPV